MEPTTSPVSYLPLLSVLDTFKLRVPSYQRPFAWREEQVDALLDDIDALGTAKESSRRFLGYLTVARSPNDASLLYLIDGQQRITSISLLCSVVCAEMRRLGMGPEAEAFERRTLFLDYGCPETYRYLPQDYSDTGLGVKHRGGLQSIYRHILAGDLGLSADDALSGQATPAARRLAKTREKMSLWVRRKMSKREHVADMLSRLSRVDVVLHLVSNDAEGAEIFDGINNRGKHLSDVEKIKSYALYLYNKSLAEDALIDRIEKTNGIFELTYQAFDKYVISDDKSETQFVDAYHHCFADQADTYLQVEGAVGEYSSDADGAESVRSLLPVSVLSSAAIPKAVECLNQYLNGYPKAAEWFGDVARVQKDDCYLDYADSEYRGELIAISQCLKLLRRSTVAAPLVMAFRKVNPQDVEGLIGLLRYMERLMFQLSLDGRQVNKGAALITRFARETVREALSATEIIRRIHDRVAPEDEDLVRVIFNDEELGSSAEKLSYQGTKIAPAVLYAHYHWLKKNKFKVSYYGLRRAITKDEFHFVVKPTRFGKIHRDHDDNRSKTWRDHPANWVSDSSVVFDEGDVEQLKIMMIRERLGWLSNRYRTNSAYFSLDGSKSPTWLENKGEEFSEWFVRRWSLKSPHKLPAVRINLHDIDFEATEPDDSSPDDDAVLFVP